MNVSTAWRMVAGRIREDVGVGVGTAVTVGEGVGVSNGCFA